MSGEKLKLPCRMIKRSTDPQLWTGRNSFFQIIGLGIKPWVECNMENTKKNMHSVLKRRSHEPAIITLKCKGKIIMERE